MEVFLIIAAIFILAFLAYVLGNLFKHVREEKALVAFADKWEAVCLTANREFEKYRQVNRVFTDSEKDEFIQKYRSSYDNITSSGIDFRKFISKSTTSRDFEEEYDTEEKKLKFTILRKRLVPVSDFCYYYSSIDKIQKENNERHGEYVLTIADLKWVVDLLEEYAEKFIPHFVVDRIVTRLGKRSFWTIENSLIIYPGRKGDRYTGLFEDFRQSKLALFIDKQREIDEVKKDASRSSFEWMFPNRSASSSSKSVFYEGKVCSLEEALQIIQDKPTFADWVREHNEQFVLTEKVKHSKYFDKLFAYPLDAQQREAIVIDEDNDLIIASAGSGKTSTIVGKAHYLVEKCGVRPEDILVVTYTRKAAAELRERMGIDGITSATFNSHALTTIGQITGRKPDIADGGLLSNIFNSILNSDEAYLEAANKYTTILVDRSKDDDDYGSAKERVADMQKNGLISPYPDMDGNRVHLKSKQEKMIAIILSELGVDFRYEEAYEYDTSSSHKRQYRPDFVIHYDATEIDDEGNEVVRHKTLYYEHFGVGVDGNVPKWFGDGMEGGWLAANAKYKAGMNWKIALHREYNTSLIYTTSADFITQADIRSYIMSLLEQHKVPINILSEQQKRARMKDIDGRIDDSLCQLISGFITLMKANQYELSALIGSQTAADSKDAERNAFMLEKLVKPVFDKYQAELESRNQIDFTDSLLIAAKLCKDSNPYSYKYILVDEFQDMSLDKYAYLKALRLDTDACFTRLFCVGDDWQSIYRFSGSDMTLFYNFADNFGVTAECKIETTHRFGEPLLTTSSKFILANPEQKSKSVKTTSGSTYIKLFGQKDSDTKDALHRIIKDIPEDESVYVLGRYKVGVSVLAEKGKTLEYDPNAEYTIEGHRVRYLTIHSAKGLEADHVIVINCDNGAFPSDIEDDPMLELVLSGADSFEYAEERRLFYVAITRARKCTYVLYDYENPSPFIQELGEYRRSANSTDIQCPRCKRGYVRILKDAVSKDGRRYISVNCTNGCCDYFENLFDTNIFKYVQREVHFRADIANFCYHDLLDAPYYLRFEVIPKHRLLTISGKFDEDNALVYIPQSVDIESVDSMHLWGKQFMVGYISNGVSEMNVLVPCNYDEAKELAQARLIDIKQGDKEGSEMKKIVKRVIVTEDEISQYERLIHDFDKVMELGLSTYIL